MKLIGKWKQTEDIVNFNSVIADDYSNLNY